MSNEEASRISRRRLVRGLALLPFGAIMAACSGKADDGAATTGVDADSSVRIEPAPPAPTATPQPFILPAGEQSRLMMEGTPQETPLYVFGSGLPGPVVMALGGVHGNEPGGWMAAEEVAERIRPDVGALLVLPRANRLAINIFERTTDELGDLNRLYPGDPNGLPMERMAFEIIAALREFHVGYVVDMHESWAFFKDRPQNGTAFLGQTVSTRPDEEAMELGRAVVEAVNTRILASREEFFFREFPSRQSAEQQFHALPGSLQGGGSRSSLGLPAHVPGLTAFLVEMGQQQELSRRVALHVDVLREVMRRVGVAA